MPLSPTCICHCPTLTEVHYPLARMQWRAACTHPDAPIRCLAAALQRLPAAPMQQGLGRTHALQRKNTHRGSMQMAPIGPAQAHAAAAACMGLFGSLHALHGAEADELTGVGGLSPAQAQAVSSFFAASRVT